MNVEQHIKVAQWHLEQARLHSNAIAKGEKHSCGCPVGGGPSNEDIIKLVDEAWATRTDAETSG